MEIFSQLNAEGRTVVLITHEDDVAAYARRVVRLRDGHIVGDQRRAPDAEHAVQEARPAASAGASTPERVLR
jgi:putative ABC transport system ATP-binding protein